MIKRERALTLGATINDFTTAQVTEWGFDDNSRLNSHKDDSPNESTWAYDALDRVVSLTYPDSTSAAYVYDDAHNITQVTDPAGNVIADTFDSLNRNTARSITRATGFLGTTSEARVYDGLNRMTSNDDNDYDLDFEYTVIGLDSYLHEETQSYVGQTAYPKSVNYAWDANGNLTSETYPTGCNLTVSRTYNDADLLTQIDDGTNTIASYTWIGVRKQGTTYGNSSTRTNTYTGFRSEIGSIQHTTSGQSTIVRLDYGYNKVHDRLYERFGASGASGDAFAYDKMRRLTNAWMGSVQPSSPSGQTYVKKIDYNYDDDGNRNSVALTLWNQNPANTSYTTNNLNQYTVVGGTSRSHDSNGNLTDNGTYQFKYDYKNQIVQVIRKSDSTTIASYRYDALGRRAEKNTLANGVERHVRSTVAVPGTTVENFSHVIAVFDGTNNWIQNSVFNDEIDGVQMLEQADVLDHDADGNTAELTRSYYHRNELGSVMEITDALEQTVVSYRYDPYGQVTITRNGQTQSSDPLGQYWTFTGRFHDEESGLYHYRARAYDPDSGRFFQRDRLGYAVDPNLMQYVGSSPSTLIDPSGNRPDTSPRACDATLSLPVDTGPAHSWSSPEGKRLRTRLRMSNWGRDSLVKMRLLPALEDAQKSVEVWEGLKDKMLDRDPNRAGQTSDGGDPVMSIRQVDRWIRRAKAVRTPIELLLGRSWAKGPPSLEDAENAQEAAEAMLDQAILFNSLINPWGTRDPAADDKGS